MTSNADSSLSWKDYVGNITEDCTIFGEESDSDSARIRLAAEPLTALFEEFYKAQAELIHQAPGLLEETILN